MLYSINLTNDAVNFLFDCPLETRDKGLLLSLQEEQTDPINESVVSRPEIIKVDGDILVVEWYPQIGNQRWLSLKYPQLFEATELRL